MILTLIAENASYCAVPIMAIIAAAGEIYSIGKGVSQDAKAKKMEKGLRRPEYNAKPYEIPKEVDQYLQKAKMEALDQKLPGQQVMEERIGSATSNAVAATQQSGGSSAEVLNTVASIQSGENRAMNELNVLAAQDQIRKQANVDQALSTKAEYQDKKYGIDLQNADKAFQINQYDPYKEKAAAISALKGASSQNIYTGIEGISSIAMDQAELIELNKTPEQRQLETDKKNYRTQKKRDRWEKRTGKQGGGESTASVYASLGDSQDYYA